MTWRIYLDVLKSIMEFSRIFYPNEFCALLYCDISDKIIKEIYIIPNTQSGQDSAIFRADLVPMSFNIAGSVHSHPSGNGAPSSADLIFFSSKQINLIVYPPFDLASYKVYNQKGEVCEISVIIREK
jgi:proteasome lid subunit RPN8/RPN11